MKNLFFLTLCFFGLASVAFAADRVILFRTPEQVIVHSPFRVDVLLETGGDSINALSGTVSLVGPAEIKRVAQNASIVPLWVSDPSFGKDFVTYEGIIPGGFDGVYSASSENPLPGSIISFDVLPTGVGDIVLSSRATAYQNDGLGTEVFLPEVTSIIQSVDATSSLPQHKAQWLFGLFLVCDIIFLLWFFKIFFVKRRS